MLIPAASPARKGEKGYKYIAKEAAADAAAGAVMDAGLALKIVANLLKINLLLSQKITIL